MARTKNHIDYIGDAHMFSLPDENNRSWQIVEEHSDKAKAEFTESRRLYQLKRIFLV